MGEGHPFAKADVSILRDDRVSDRGFRLYVAIVHRIGSNGHCWPSKKVLAEDLRRSVRSVQYGLQELADVGVILIERQRGRVSRYSLSPQPNEGKDLPIVQNDEGNNLLGGEQVSAGGGAGSCSPYKNKNQEEEPLKEREASLGACLDDVFGKLPRFEAPFKIRWRPPDDLKHRQAEVVRVMAAWHQHIGPVRTLTSNAGANICHRLDDWTADELVQAVVGYAKATSKWRGNGRKAKNPAVFFANDDDIQNYVLQGADNVPVDQLPKLMRRLVNKEFSNVQFHREALMDIQSKWESGELKGSAIENMMNESNCSVDQFLEKIQRMMA